MLKYTPYCGSATMCGAKIRRETMMLWILAIGFYVVGDTTTTMLSIRAGSVEANPLVAHLFEAGDLSLFLLSKAGLVAVAFLASVIDPYPDETMYPMILTIVGGILTAWNLGVFLIAFLSVAS